MSENKLKILLDGPRSSNITNDNPNLINIESSSDLIDLSKFYIFIFMVLFFITNTLY